MTNGPMHEPLFINTSLCILRVNFKVCELHINFLKSIHGKERENNVFEIFVDDETKKK